MFLLLELASEPPVVTKKKFQSATGKVGEFSFPVYSIIVLLPIRELIDKSDEKLLSIHQVWRKWGIETLNLTE